MYTSSFKVGKDWGAPYASYEPPPLPKEDSKSESIPIGTQLNLTPGIEEKSVGTLLVSMIGDILGAPVEGWRPSMIKGHYGLLRDFVKGKHMGVPDEERFGMYTDDTNSTLALASSLVTKSGLDPQHVAMENCYFYQHHPIRGYSENSLCIMKAILNGEETYMTSGTAYLEKGSWANGGAMKISPVGICFRNCSDEILYEAARLAVLSTHTHKLGIDGAWVQAKAISILINEDPSTFDPILFLNSLLDVAKTKKMKYQIKNIIRHLNLGSDAETVTSSIMNSVPEIGTFFQISASQALPCALWALAKYPMQPELGLIQSVNMGGDTDTIACISGAQFGALWGTQWIPHRWFDNVENGTFGRDYCISLGKQLSTFNFNHSHFFKS